ncbi:MAG TPA: hypothetical protein VIG66_00170 [Noviherbaspirillum sp.]
MSLRVTHCSTLLFTLVLAACGGGSTDDQLAGESPTQGAQFASTEATIAVSTDVSTDGAEAPVAHIDEQAEASPTFDPDEASSVNDGPAVELHGGATVATAAPSVHRGMWSWRDSDIKTASARQKLIDFAVDRKITSVYVSAQWLMRDTPQELAAFIDLAASKDISVELLLASHDWALTENHQLALDQVKKANAFVKGLTGAKPVALHFDVEPHSLPGWANNQVSYGNQLIDLYTKLRQARDPSLRLNADIAMSYRTIKITRSGVTKTLAQWMVDKSDSTTLMAYRDYATGPDSITYHADHPINYAAKKGKVSYVGVETTCGLEPVKITFCEEKQAGMNAALSTVVSTYEGNAGFGGLAIHDYAGYSILP